MSTVIRFIFIFSLSYFFAACSKIIAVKKSQYDYKEINIDKTLDSDWRIDSIIRPKKRILDSLMNGTIAYSNHELLKEKPSGSLNNFCADLMLQIGKKVDSSAEICIVNYGGIRLNSLPLGDISTGKIFELLPFDNMIVLQKIQGRILQDVLDYIASQGGWPVAGIQLDIKNKKAIHVLINAKAIDPDKMYNLVLSDYLANGGDNLTMLRSIPQVNTNLIMREAFIRELKQMHQIQFNNEQRIKNVD